MIAEIITLITVIGIVFCFGFICSGAIFCCCALSSMNVFGALLCCTAGLLKENYRRHTERYSSSGHAYQNRNYTDVNTHAHNSTYSGAAPVLVQSNDILLAEAYLVAPLAEARIVSENLSVENGTTTNQRNSEFEQSNALERDGGAFPTMIFKDVWAALLFIAQVIVIVYFAVEACLKALKISDPNIAPADGLGTIVVAFAILGALATILGTVCLTIVLRNADYIIEGVMWTNIGACSVGAVLCLASGGGAIFAVVLGITAALNYWYLNSVRDRISFASAVLSVACQAIKDNYIGIVMSAYMLLFAQLVWFILWSIASYGIACQFFMIDDSKNENHGDDVNAEYAELNGGQWTILFLLLLSLHWGSEVVRTLLQTTVNGVIACWWFQPRRSAVVRGALFRSVTTSFGSVCFGSFLVSVIHALRDLLSMIANKRDENGRRDRGAGAALAGCAEFLLHLVEKALKYFNKYAYCYVAGYGMGFLESASKVTTLFQEKGWTAIVNDNLVSNALTFAVLGMTAVTAVLGAFSSIFLRVPLERVGVTDPLIVLSIVGALMGFAVSIVLTNALSSGVAMVFVCMAENPDALKVSKKTEIRSIPHLRRSVFDLPHFTYSLVLINRRQ